MPHPEAARWRRVVERVNRDIARVVAEPEVRERLSALGAEPMPMSPAEFDRFMRAEMDEAARVVQAAGIQVQ